MTPTFIVDCSITMAWCFADERSAETAALQERLADEAALVPTHWALEVANVLAMAEKRKRISAADSRRFVELLGVVDIQVDDQIAARTFDHILPLCRAHSLTSYDAAYLDLAVRRQLPLATLDEDLRRAAENLNVVLLGQ
ncbi:MAG TPA: type II toxin-antitoxin system VapC family toxin [Planctomycetaceae bacterium]|nr:type II toxin-antitoxin system VapC family toxin [Planctomycetaceae bacterium]